MHACRQTCTRTYHTCATVTDDVVPMNRILWSSLVFWAEYCATSLLKRIPVPIPHHRLWSRSTSWIVQEKHAEAVIFVWSFFHIIGSLSFRMWSCWKSVRSGPWLRTKTSGEILGSRYMIWMENEDSVRHPLFQCLLVELVPPWVLNVGTVACFDLSWECVECSPVQALAKWLMLTCLRPTPTCLRPQQAGLQLLSQGFLIWDLQTMTHCRYDLLRLKTIMIWDLKVHQTLAYSWILHQRRYREVSKIHLRGLRGSKNKQWIDLIDPGRS